MLLGSLKTEGVIEVLHQALGICIVAPCHNLIVSLGLFDMLKISS